MNRITFSLKIIFSFCSLALFACDGSSSGSNTNINNTGSTNSGAQKSLETQYAQELYKKINQQRAQRDLPELILDNRISDLAQNHNQYMANQTTTSGSPEIQISHDHASERYDAIFTFGYTNASENVAGQRGYPASRVTDLFVQNWLDSPGHYKNIIGDFTHTGIDVKVDQNNGTIYATQLFAK